ncbi:hypothetical protein NA57DRAFT_55009 [Rhizodiscina lignyota]|uniref:SPX domain-containing protein n=1 Tax=Rhizodiscina lignyota TaxID=1504668 RepID=A0A9P4IM28_9PEZI|nr:hypothetical protein NA57DRAFT_55009 [Rhizodiscina lignyota]
MKYGQTLKQRSILEWGHYNLDYDEVKHLIKEHTSPGKGKAVSIPGRGNVSERDFESLLFNVLRDQFVRIELFVKSKNGEIERRLDHLSRQIRVFRNQIHLEQSSNLPIRRLERYARIESDILRAGQEIRSLSRFVGAQRLGFLKLLKKYRKWTGSTKLPERFKSEVLDQSLVLSRHNLDALLDHWAEVLHAFRAPFEALTAKNNPLRRFSSVRPPGGRDASSTIIQQLQYASSNQSEVDFDTAFVTLPIGDAGQKAVYWIHPDQVVEITVLLLQYLRLLSPKGGPSGSSAPQSARGSRKSSVSKGTLSRHDSISSPDAEIDAGLCIIDDIDDFAQKQSSSTYNEIQHPASGSKAPVGRFRWTSKSDAVFVLKSVQQGAVDLPCGYRATRLKRKYLDDYLDTRQPFTKTRRASIPADDGNLEARQSSPEALNQARTWLEKNERVKPLATVASKRTRFTGLMNEHSHGQWAVLDQNIYMAPAAPAQLCGNEWTVHCRNEGTHFPYAVLQVRQEGVLAMDLIDLLDRNYLTERVRGFSLEAQAVWTSCKPTSMAPPSWLPLLERDIRKLPTKEAPQRPHSIVAFSQSDSVSAPSDLDGAGDLSSSTGGRPTYSSQTSWNPSTGAQAGESSSSTPIIAPKEKPKKKKRKLRLPPEIPKEAPIEQGYWNEYDFPDEEEDNSAYVLYVDPNAAVGYPGQETLEKIVHWIRNPFKHPDEERQLLLSPTETLDISPGSPGGDDEESSSDEASPTVKRRSYGTIVSIPSPPPGEEDTSFFTHLNPFAQTKKMKKVKLRRKSAHQHQHLDPFTAEIERQFLARESSKLRTCLTSLAASVAILVVVFVLAATGRRRQLGTVDEGIMFGVVTSLLFAMVGVGYMLSLSWDGWEGEDRGKHLTRKRIIRAAIGILFIAICVANGSLIAFMVA